MPSQDINIEEVSLVLFLLSKDSYNKYFSYLIKLNMEHETKNLLKTISEYFSAFPEVKDIKVEELLIYFANKHPVLKKKASYSLLLSKLQEIAINPKVLEENLNHFMEQYFASEILLKLTDVIDGVQYDVLDEVSKLIDDFNANKIRLGKDESEMFVNSTLEDLLYKEVTRPGLKWRLSCLNDNIGELRGCSLGHVFARVDTGKTSFLVSEVTNFATQLKDDEIILWLNNEEAGSKVQFRLYQSMLQATKDQLIEYENNADKEFEKRGGRRIKIYDNAMIKFDEIEQMLTDYNVRLLVVDQGDKVHFSGEKDYSSVDRLKVLYGKFRELAKKHDLPILTVGQASAPAEGQKWLRLDYMDNSKTGKPGELDYAIGIGKYQKDIENGIDTIRYISVCKNKMNNGMHGMHAVYFNSTCALYLDTANDSSDRGAIDTSVSSAFFESIKRLANE